MRSAAIAVAAAALVAPVIAAPVPGGYFNNQGVWCDDGYWYWNKIGSFIPWASSYIPEQGCAAPTAADNAAPNPQPTGNYASNSDGTLQYSGKGTYYYQGGVAGACGTVHNDGDYIVALQTAMYANGAHCGEKIQVRNLNTGASVVATVADLCPSCETSGSVDLSVATFQALGTLDQGVVSIGWAFE